MTKKIISCLFVAGLLMFSCKKAYTCDCELKENYNSADTSYTNMVKTTSSAYSKKMTKKQAQAACDQEAVAVKTNYNSFSATVDAALGIQNDPNDVITSSCTLK